MVWEAISGNRNEDMQACSQVHSNILFHNYRDFNGSEIVTGHKICKDFAHSYCVRVMDSDCADLPCDTTVKPGNGVQCIESTVVSYILIFH